MSDEPVLENISLDDSVDVQKIQSNNIQDEIKLDDSDDDDNNKNNNENNDNLIQEQDDGPAEILIDDDDDDSNNNENENDDDNNKINNPAKFQNNDENFVPSPVIEQICDKFEVQVCEPIKVGEGMSAHIDYTIKIKTNIIGQQDYSIARRYSDFKWLYDTLKSVSASRVVPPVPGKALINRFSEQFIAVRCFELNQFLQLVAAHPQHGVGEPLAAFLSPDAAVFARARAEEAGTAPHDVDAPGSSLKSAADTLGAFASGVWHGLTALPAQVARAATAPPAEIDPWFNEAQGRVRALRLACAACAAGARQRADETRNSDDGSHSGARGMAHALGELARAEAQHDEQSAKRAGDVAAAAEHECELFNQFSSELREVMEFPIDYYTRLIDEVQSTLDHRLDALAECNARKQAVLTMQTNSGADAVQVDSDQLEQARNNAKIAEEVFDDVSETVRNEVTWFFAGNGARLQAMLRAYAVANMSLASQNVENWRKLVIDLNSGKR